MTSRYDYEPPVADRDPMRWIRDGQLVRARYGRSLVEPNPDAVRATGKVIAYCPEPTVVIETNTGERIQWAISLVDPVDEPAQDPVGTVRRDTAGLIWVLVGHSVPLPWWPITEPTDGRYKRLAHVEMAGTERIGAVPGTPADVPEIAADVLAERTALLAHRECG